jgi:hypothetical protein
MNQPPPDFLKAIRRLPKWQRDILLTKTRAMDAVPVWVWRETFSVLLE